MNGTLEKPSPKDQVRGFRVCEDQRPKRQLHILLCCEILKFFLTHPTKKNECSTSEDTQNSSEVDVESSRCPRKSESWNNPNCDFSCDECMRSNEPSVFHKL